MNKKPFTLLAVLFYSISLSATPFVACVEYGQVSIDSKTFNHYYCYTHENSHKGIPTPNQYDTAHITAVFNNHAYQNKIIQARLFKYAWCTEDGLTALCSIGECWIDEGTQFFSVGYEPVFSFKHYLDFSGIVWPADPEDIVDHCGTSFGNVEWNICYRVNWWYSNEGYFWYEIGWSDEVPGYKVWTSHDEMEPEAHNYIICSCCTHYPVHLEWSETWKSANINNIGGGVGRVPNRSFVQLKTYSRGSVARLVYDLSSLDSGDVWVYGDSSASPFSRLLVYCSNDNNSWRLASDQLIRNSGNRWINCGDPEIDYRYVMFLAYNSGIPSWISIDAVNTGNHY